MSRICMPLAAWSLIAALGCAETPEPTVQNTSADTRALSAEVETEENSEPNSRPWRIYDAMHDRPNSQSALGRYGIVPAHVFLKGSFYRTGEDQSEPPTEHRVQEFAQTIPHEVITCMDLEGEDWTNLFTWDAEAKDWRFNESGYQTMLGIARWINEANPELRWGFFWRPPVGTAYRSAYRQHVEGNHERRDEILNKLREAEQRIRPLYDEVDVITLSMYYVGRRHESFEDFQRECEFVLEHWQPPVDKPVLVFMCPLDPYSNTATGARFLTAEQWRWCLEFAREHTDGVLLWSDVPFEWDVHAAGREWWRETVRFLDDIGGGGNAPN
ncbi:MAG: hypothetical protein ACP5HU_09595 [Phycisphaerae bacterium]